MPVRLGLVLVNRLSEQINNQRPQLKSQPKPTPKPNTQPVNKPLNMAQQQQDINLRRIMGAPKTSCNSCRG
jgi:hypothetical protein